MFFTRLGYGLAILGMILGVALVVTGFALDPSDKASIARYGGKYLSPGRAIDSGLYTIILSIALGILAEISYALRSRP